MSVRVTDAQRAAALALDEGAPPTIALFAAIAGMDEALLFRLVAEEGIDVFAPGYTDAREANAVWAQRVADRISGRLPSDAGQEAKARAQEAASSPAKASLAGPAWRTVQ